MQNIERNARECANCGRFLNRKYGCGRYVDTCMQDGDAYSNWIPKETSTPAEIFEWLRKMAHVESYNARGFQEDLLVIPTGRFLNIINQAEAKYKSEVEQDLYLKAYQDGQDKELSDGRFISERMTEEEVWNKAIDAFASMLTNKDNLVGFELEGVLENNDSYDSACHYLRNYIDATAARLKKGGECVLGIVQDNI